MQSGVDEGGIVLGASEERGAAGEEGQQGGADVAVHGEGRLCGAQTLLQKERMTGHTTCDSGDIISFKCT